MNHKPMPEPLFSSPQRQSPAALLIILVKTIGLIGKIFWPALLVIIFRSPAKDEAHNNKGDTFVYIILAFAIITLIATIIKYLFHRFYIADGHFIVKTGWLQKKVTSIPLQNILAVHLEQHILHRLLSVAKVALDSAGSDKVEVNIDALSLKKADELKRVLLQHSSVAMGELPVEQKISPDGTAKLSLKNLLVLSLTANHIEAFFVLLALSVNLWDDLRKIIQLDESKWVEEHTAILQNSLSFAAAVIIVVAVISVIFSFVRTAIRYFDFTIITDNNGWKMSYGLTNHQQIFLPFTKVQVLQWRSNFVRRKFNIWIMYFMSAGYSDIKKKQKVHIPVFDLLQVNALVKKYQQSEIFSPEAGSRIHASYWIRGAIYVGLIVGFIPAIPLFFWMKSVSMVWMLIMCYIVIHRIYFYRNFRWHYNEEGLQMYSGVWGRNFTLMTWNKIQQVHLTQNLFQKSRKVASVHFITAGIVVELPYIPLEQAKQLVNRSLFYVESNNENWM